MVNSRVPLALCCPSNIRCIIGRRYYSVFSALQLEHSDLCESQKTTSLRLGGRTDGRILCKKHSEVRNTRSFASAPPKPLADERKTNGSPAKVNDLLSEGTAIMCGLLPRKWECLQPCYKDDVNLRICSYNVLCQKTARRTSFLYSHLLNSEDRQCELSWPYRSALLAREFSLIEADVFCLQEVQHDHFNQFYEPVLKKAGYKGIYKKRTGRLVDGCAIFYRSNLQLVSCQNVEYIFSHCQSFNRDNVAQVARFRMPNGKEFCVANTHLVFNRRLGEVKIAQAARLLTSVYEMACDNCPYILCGDFNMQPGSPLYNFFSDGFLPLANLKHFEVSGQGAIGGTALTADLFPMDVHQNDICHIDKMRGNGKAWMHKMKFASAYNHCTEDAMPEISAYQSEEASNPDFIFYSVENKILKVKPKGKLVLEVKEDQLHLVRRLTLPSEKMLRSTLGPWPNFTTPSDHIPLVADFALF